MQILHPFTGSVQQYLDQLADFDRHRPAHCPQCQAKHPLTAHGFYTRTIVDAAFDGSIRVRRYLCEVCKRTVSLLPEFALPYLRSSVTAIALFLVALPRRKLSPPRAAIVTLPARPFSCAASAQAQALCAALAVLTARPAPDSFSALIMLESAGWIAAHRFASVRGHLLRCARSSRRPPRRTRPRRRARLSAPTPFAWNPPLFPYAQNQEKTSTQ